MTARLVFVGDCSLRDYLQGEGGSLGTEETVQVVKDIANALVGLQRVDVVHRDLKPENVLRLDGNWCLADFGISRYAEATTAPDTQKFAMSPPYAAPERWRTERATAATDVYAVGVMAFEMLSGARPFAAATREELRELHLHEEAPQLQGVPAALGALIDECLYKAPEARPAPANLRARLDRLPQVPSSGGLANLAEANRSEVRRRQSSSQQESAARTATERRAALATAGRRSYERISEALRNAIEVAASAAEVRPVQGGGWSIGLADAAITVGPPRAYEPGWRAAGVVLDVVLACAVGIKVPRDISGYEGRSHSLWFCDAQEKGRFGWYETAFMYLAFSGKQRRRDPFALDPGDESAKAVGPGVTEVQVAWPFTPLVVGELDEFIDRWTGWFAAGAQGQLSRPSTMPDRPPGDSWRKS